MTKSRRIEYVCDFDGTCDDILKQKGISSSIRVMLRKRMGLVCLLEDGREIPVILTKRLSKGDKICIYLEDDDIVHIPPCDTKINIVYEDEDIAVIDKPAGIAVIPVKNHYGRSLANCLANIWGDFVYRPVNRLDRDTSGLMIVAKNSLAHSLLTGKTTRQYLALCQGVFDKEKYPLKGTIDKPLARMENSMKRYVSDDGERAITHYEFIKQYDEYFLCRFLLETGRTHQIRVHISDMGYPLCCDKLYNDFAHPVVCPNGKILGRQALHSFSLAFKHPLMGKDMYFESKPEFCVGSDF